MITQHAGFSAVQMQIIAHSTGVCYLQKANN
jgi:hypothetical protein